MAKLNYSTGVQEFEVEGGTIRFNPADPVFVRRLYDAFSALGEQQEAGEKQNQALTGEALFEVIEEKDAEMRRSIEGVFGPGTAKMIFPEVGLYALADGLPVWCNFFFAVMDLIDTTTQEQQKKANPRVDYYMKKYGKYMKR